MRVKATHQICALQLCRHDFDVVITLQAFRPVPTWEANARSQYHRSPILQSPSTCMTLMVSSLAQGFQDTTLLLSTDSTCRSTPGVCLLLRARAMVAALWLSPTHNRCMCIYQKTMAAAVMSITNPQSLHFCLSPTFLAAFVPITNLQFLGITDHNEPNHHLFSADL